MKKGTSPKFWTPAPEKKVDINTTDWSKVTEILNEKTSPKEDKTLEIDKSTTDKKETTMRVLQQNDTPTEEIAD